MYKLSPVSLFPVKCGRFNLAVFNLTIIIQRKVDFRLGLNPRFALKRINGHLD